MATKSLSDKKHCKEILIRLLISHHLSLGYTIKLRLKNKLAVWRSIMALHFQLMQKKWSFLIYLRARKGTITISKLVKKLR